MPKANIRLDIQYKGTDFAGWQYQPNEITIQGEIEKALEIITAQKVALHGAGRTDAGVHALGQVANFHIDHYLPAEKYREALNFYLPRTIRITKSVAIAEGFRARKSAVWRHYRYIIDRQNTALFFDYRWRYPFPLNIEILNCLAEIILGRHDFSTFCTIASHKEDNSCEVYESSWHEEGSLLIYDIRANRFLHSMVRSLVGKMTEAGRGEVVSAPAEFSEIMASKDHTRIGNVAPARGLYLMEVGY